MLTNYNYDWPVFGPGKGKKRRRVGRRQPRVRLASPCATPTAPPHPLFPIWHYDNVCPLLSYLLERREWGWWGEGSTLDCSKRMNTDLLGQPAAQACQGVPWVMLARREEVGRRAPPALGRVAAPSPQSSPIEGEEARPPRARTGQVGEY